MKKVIFVLAALIFCFGACRQSAKMGLVEIMYVADDTTLNGQTDTKIFNCRFADSIVVRVLNNFADDTIVFCSPALCKTHSPITSEPSTAYAGSFVLPFPRSLKMLQMQIRGILYNVEIDKRYVFIDIAMAKGRLIVAFSNNRLILS